MKAVGLVTEYNPFHEGHMYHIEQAKKITGSDVAVVVMSGDFVQRGEPAVVDKYTRASMALKGGADLVIELPTLYATASAERFAFGAVSILHFMGIDSICFGSELGDAGMLETIAGILYEEPAGYSEAIKRYVSNGDSFPKARRNALAEYIEVEGIQGVDAAVLDFPNNLLGIEYIKAVKRFSSSMEICTIQRNGQGYNDISVPGSENASAAAIRNMLTGDKIGNEAIDKIPLCARDIFREAVDNGMIMTPDDFSYLLNYKIYSVMRDDSALLLNYSDVGMQLANKISRLYGKEHFDGSWKELIMQLKSRELTYTRISRALTHILLDIKLDAWNNPLQYARILGFDKAGSDYLGAIRKTCVIPLVTKVADESWMLKDDIYTADVYNQTVFEKCGIRIENDFRHGIIRMQ